MDTHDVTRDRICSTHFACEANTFPPSEDQLLRETFSAVLPRALVVSVATDLLFPPEQQVTLARCLPQAKFIALESPDGHDGLLLEFETLDRLILEHLMEQCLWIYEGKSLFDGEVQYGHEALNSVFEEAENLGLSGFCP